MQTTLLGRPTAGQKALWEMEGARFRLECQRFIAVECSKMMDNWSPMAELCRRIPPSDTDKGA